jgi:hypothetical protein
MAGTNGTGTETVSGVVSAVNPKGIRLEGRDGWLNFSKFAGDLVPPARGAHVAVTLDGQGFIRALAPADGPPDAPQSHTAGRETAIIRQTCLKAAAEFCASRPELKSAELFALAERMEAWVTR